MKLQKVDLRNSLQVTYRHVGENLSNSSDPVVVILEAGHFHSSRGPDQHAINTLKGALDLATNLIVEHGRKIRVVLALLVDDLGIGGGFGACSVNGTCSWKGSLSLPGELVSILESSPIYKARQFVVSSERTAKNRGIAHLKKIIAGKHLASGNIFQLEEEGQKRSLYFSGSDGQQVLLADIRDQVWSLRCPMIMAQHYFDLHEKVSKRYPNAWPRMLIDFSTMYERGKVNAGAELALQLLSLEGLPGTCEITNIFFTDESGDGYLMDRFNQ